MNKKINENLLWNVGEIFNFDGKILNIERYGNGHINDTFLVSTTFKKYIMQRMNSYVFKNPLEVIENIRLVTSFLKNEISKRNGDVSRETLSLIFTKEGLDYYIDEEKNYWRAYNFINDATSYDQVENEQDFYESAVAFGKFQNLLAKFPSEKLHETIKDFHNTSKRFKNLLEAINKDSFNRKNTCLDEINFFIENKKIALKNLDIPLRVTHNDTKLNNIMIDNKTHKGVCVIDLDTIMPGYAIFDFGDSIRFGASTASEDEQDLTKVNLDLNLFKTYALGFIQGTGNKLTNEELKLMSFGALRMTYECGMRFLTDYLDGDIYFKTHCENHNLFRARTQIKLAKEMIINYDKMVKIIDEIATLTTK